MLSKCIFRGKLNVFMIFFQPEIPKYGKGMPSNPTPQGANEKDFISYTVSAPSGRGTALFSADGNTFSQILLITFIFIWSLLHGSIGELLN